jgi:hypothetical protein
MVVQFCFDNAGVIGASNDIILQTQTTGIGSVLCLSTTSKMPDRLWTDGSVPGVSDNFFPAQKRLVRTFPL